jgi:hypothetical protein
MVARAMLKVFRRLYAHVVGAPMKRAPSVLPHLRPLLVEGIAEKCQARKKKARHGHSASHSGVGSRRSAPARPGAV